MRMFTTLRRGSRALVLALLLVGATSASAWAAPAVLTIDDTAQLSPGMLHATLTGTITCDDIGFPFPGFFGVSGQIVQRDTTGNGSIAPTCDGTPHPYAIDVAAGSSGPFGGGGGAFKPGRASAQVSTVSCDPITFACTSSYVDAVIRLKK